jgi:SAM-dependent methyltransferase
MWKELSDLLVCTSCAGELQCHAVETCVDGEVLEGTLACLHCRASYPVRGGIPRFVSNDNYAASFGYQWNTFRKQQIDSETGLTQSRRRFYSETGWSGKSLSGKLLLEVGCGAGRFLDIAANNDCTVVGMDITSAVDAARTTATGRRNVHLVQASIYHPPFRPGTFDGCYCLGVIQHTPDPEAATGMLPKLVKPGGRLALTVYERKPYTLLNAKYLVRPLTRRLGDKALLRMIRIAVPLSMPITEVLFRIPLLGKLFRFLIPVANYVDEPELTLRQRYEWALVDTFDMLSPAYDEPQREADLRRVLESEGVCAVMRLPNPGLNLVGTRAPRPGDGRDAGLYLRQDSRNVVG